MPTTIGAAQQLHLDLMKLSSFNDFDGPAVAASLVEHGDLWRSAVMVDEGGDFPYCTLRDLPDEHNVSTLWLGAETGQEAALEALANTWHADEIGWHGRIKNWPGLDIAVLRVWWD